MKSTLLGAVGASRLLLPAHPAGDGGEVAPRNHRLNLQRGGGRGGAKGKIKKDRMAGQHERNGMKEIDRIKGHVGRKTNRRGENERDDEGKGEGQG